MPLSPRARDVTIRTDYVQHLYTANPNSPPPNNVLTPGEIGLELADPMKVWAGVPTSMDASGRKLLLDTSVLNGGIAFVIHDASLIGDGTLINPLSVDIVDGGTF